MKTTLCMVGLIIAVIVSIIGFNDSVNVPKVGLLEAINQGDALLVQQHIDAGTDPNKVFVPEEAQYFEGASALHLAIFNRNREIVEILLASNVDLEIRADDAAAGTALHWAAFWGLNEMASLLIEAGADVNSTDNGRCTPLCAATGENPFVDNANEDFKLGRTRVRDLLENSGAK